MNSFKEICVILLMMLISGLAGFSLYHFVIAPQSETNIIDTSQMSGAGEIKLQEITGDDRTPEGETEGGPRAVNLSSLIANDMQAKPVALDQWAGKVLVINFWATWCPPCRKEIPVLIDAQKSYAEHNVQFLGIAMDDPKAVAKYMQQTDFNYPILISDLNETVRLGQAFDYNFIALPFTLFLSADGQHSHAHTGELHKEELDGLIRKFITSSTALK